MKIYQKKAFLSNKSYGLLLFIFIFLYTCKKESNTANISQIEKKDENNDSIKFSVNFKENAITLLNVPDAFLHSYPLKFINTGNNDKKIIKTIFKDHKSMVIYYAILPPPINGKRKKITQTYLISMDSTLNLDYDVRAYRFEDNIHSIDSISTHYEKIKRKIFPSNNRIVFKNELDTLYHFYDKKFKTTGEKVKSQINQIHYYEKLQLIEPFSSDVDNFIKTLSKDPVVSSTLRDLFYGYAEKRINTFNYDKLNIENYSESYIHYVSLGVFAFLRFKDNKGQNKFLDAKKWLRSTKLYSENTIAIDKEITPLNNVIFKEKLNKLSFFSISDEKSSISKIIKQNASPYYLIDFWATWCAPCIQGVKTMTKMDVPKNVRVISLSIDKVNDKEKWRTKTKELEQSITYWLDEDEEESKAFLKFIELQSIPRYILIDKNMNLIDQAFHHPQQPQFLPKLQDIRNHKFW